MPQGCSAGDSAPYERRNAMLDDVVIVSALRTPLTKVGQPAGLLDRPPCAAAASSASELLVMHLHE